MNTLVIKENIKKVFLCSFFFIVSCIDKKDPEPKKLESQKLNQYSNELSEKYYSFIFKVIQKSDGYRPPVAARAYAYLGLSVYESCVFGMEKHQSLLNNFPEIKAFKPDLNKKYHWGEVANRALQISTKNYILTTTQQDDQYIDDLAKSFSNEFAKNSSEEVLQRSRDLADSVCRKIYLYSIDDKQSSAYRDNKPLDFEPKVGPGLWRRTPPDLLNALTPRWGNVRTLFTEIPESFFKKPKTYETVKNSGFYQEAGEVLKAVNNIDIEHKWIAEFWSDDLNSYTIDAAGRWLKIANDYMTQNKVNLENSLYILNKLGIGLHDAAVACWKEKYFFNVLRPVSYINDNIDPKWRPILRDPTKPVGSQIGVTPQHPSYPSGHSVFGALAAGILIKEFGDVINFTDRTHEKETYFDGRPRTYTSFTQMAEENAYSRIPLGVHYRMDCVEGLRLGYHIADKINAVNFKLIQ
jgi:hypothetical protein